MEQTTPVAVASSICWRWIHSGELGTEVENRLLKLETIVILIIVE